jgi:hypothetical protein
MSAPALVPEPIDYQAIARSIWPGASYIRGDGPFATIRGCGDQTTVYLWPTVDQGRSALRNIHHWWGHDVCQLKHVLIELRAAP